MGSKNRKQIYTETKNRYKDTRDCRHIMGKNVTADKDVAILIHNKHKNNIGDTSYANKRIIKVIFKTQKQ